MRTRTQALWAATTIAQASLLFLCSTSLSAAASSSAIAPESSAPSSQADLASTHASPDVRAVTRWIFASNDNQRLPFAVVDKKDARLYVFSAQGRLVGVAPALLGLARGDHSVPGIGDGDLSKIPPEDRTTPAGRFVSEPGQHISGERVVWIDYDAALSIHRLRPASTAEHRPERLASAAPDDHRISLGCVIVDGRFYDQVVLPTLGDTQGVVYVLPETRPLASVFGPQLTVALPASTGAINRQP